MSTIQINSIEGRRGSICNNDAYSVVSYEDRIPHVLAFVPAASLNGKSPEQIGNIFARAVETKEPALVAAVKEAASNIRPRELAL